MIVTKLRAAATALLLGMAVVTAGGILSAAPAEAAVRSSVGKPLQEAIAAVKAGNCQGATANIHKAEAVGGLSAEEEKILTQTKQYAEVTFKGQCGVTSSQGAQAKFDADYNARRYRDVIADEDLLRKFNALNSQNMVVIGQAYYLSGDYRACVKYANAHTGAGPSMLDLALRCAYETHDPTLMREAAESLVASNGSPKNWSQLLAIAEGAKQLTDPQTRDLYRLAYMTGAMAKADEYMTLAQLLLAARLPSEARAVVERGMQAKLLVDARAQRLYALTKTNQAGDVANLPKAAAAAQKASKGDDLVNLGEDYTGMGKFPEAIQAIQAGIAKGVSDMDNAQVRLAVAYYGAKQKPQALAALAKATNSPNGSMVARMWATYIRQH
jgi:hypothetical protein